LYSQTSIVTNPGAGFNGADASRIATGATLFGSGATQGSNRLADDFTVPASGWLVDSISVYAYRTNTYTYPPASPFTGITLNIWNGVPGAGGSIIASSNTLGSTNWTGIYRVNNTTTLTNAQRPVMNVAALFPNLLLTQGTYWADWSLTAGGTLFVPPLTTTSGTLVTGNARQFTNSTSTWADVIDAGNPTPLPRPVDFPFAVSGSIPTPVPFEFDPTAGIVFLGAGWLVRRTLKKKLN
jgi:hypothetical protein